MNSFSIRRWKIRARHIRPFVPAFMREFLARWYNVAFHRMSVSIREDLTNRDRKYTLAMIDQMSRYGKLSLLWKFGYIVPDHKSDDPAERKAHESCLSLGNLISTADAICEGNGDAIINIIDKKPILFSIPKHNDGIIYHATYDVNANVYAITGRADARIDRRSFIFGFTNGEYHAV